MDVEEISGLKQINYEPDNNSTPDSVVETATKKTNVFTRDLVCEKESLDAYMINFPKEMPTNYEDQIEFLRNNVAPKEGNNLMLRDITYRANDNPDTLVNSKHNDKETTLKKMIEEETKKWYGELEKIARKKEKRYLNGCKEYVEMIRTNKVDVNITYTKKYKPEEFNKFIELYNKTKENFSFVPEISISHIEQTGTQETYISVIYQFLKPVNTRTSAFEKHSFMAKDYYANSPKKIEEIIKKCKDDFLKKLSM